MAKKGKSKSKGRKPKLSRPPKRKKPAFGYESGLPYAGPLPEDWGAELPEDWEDELPERPSGPPGAQEPGTPREPGSGAIDPSMRHSRRYQKFQAKLREVVGSLPEGTTTFAAYDLPDLTDRNWLRRFCIRRDQGELPPWQEAALNDVGFNWKHGRKPPTPEEEREKEERRLRLERERKEREERRERRERNARLKRERKLERKRERELERERMRMEKTARREAARAALYDAFAAKVREGGPDLFPLDLELGERSWFRGKLAAWRNGELSSEDRAWFEALGVDPAEYAVKAMQEPWLRRAREYREHTAVGGKAEPSGDLGIWVRRQAAARGLGKLSAWQVRLLDALDFDWEQSLSGMEAGWLRRLERFRELKAGRGRRPLHEVLSENGLASWAGRMRKYHAQGLLRPAMVRRFREAGFVLETRKERYDRRWERMFKKLVAFKERFGHPMVPAGYQEDPELGRWLSQQRERMSLGKQDAEKERRLLDLGVARPRSRGKRAAPVVHISAWTKRFEGVREWLKAGHGGVLSPEAAQALSKEDRDWFERQRKAFEAGRLASWQRKALLAIGYDPADPPSLRRLPRRYPRPYSQPALRRYWDEMFKRLSAFTAKHGHTQVPPSHDDSALANFVARQRTKYNRGELTEWHIERLRSIGFVFDAVAAPTPSWMDHYRRLKAYRREHGHCAVPRKYPPDQALAEFVAAQKQRGRKGRLRREQIRLLDEVAFPWVEGKRPVPRDGEG